MMTQEDARRIVTETPDDWRRVYDEAMTLISRVDSLQPWRTHEKWKSECVQMAANLLRELVPISGVLEDGPHGRDDVLAPWARAVDLWRPKSTYASVAEFLVVRGQWQWCSWVGSKATAATPQTPGAMVGIDGHGFAVTCGPACPPLPEISIGEQS